MGSHVFVSHASEDSATAKTLVVQIESSGIPCWFAVRDITPGAIYAEAIVEAVDQSFALLLLHSSNANHSPHVVREVERAVSKGRPVITLKIDTIPLAKALEYLISASQWLDAENAALSAVLPAVVKALRRLRDQREGSDLNDRNANLNPAMVAFYQIRIVSGPNKGEVHYLNNVRMVIGRSSICDIILTDKRVSRTVGALVWNVEDCTHHLVDFHNHNPFTVNGVRLESDERELARGDRIAIGSSEMVYEPIADS